MKKIFYNHTIILLGNKPEWAEFFPSSYRYTSTKSFQNTLNKILGSTTPITAYIHHHDEEKLLSELTRFFPTRVAAGGIVQRENKTLAIYKQGRWDFPKGHLDKGETLEECAIREVYEETGLNPKDLSIGHKIAETFHVYLLRGSLTLKHSHWYSMTYSGSTKTTPQTEEGITAIKWFGKNKLPLLLSNIHPSLNDIAYGLLKPAHTAAESSSS